MSDDSPIRKVISPTASLFASEAVWIEGLALQQLENTGRLSGMLRCVGMPDLNPGKGSPIGAAFLSRLLYPALVGTDIGCGMSFYATDLPVRKAKIDKLRSKLDGLDEPYEAAVDDLLRSHGAPNTPFDSSLGTPGHGNHFIEVQELLTIREPAIAQTLGLSSETFYVLVHSGSRGFGEAIFEQHAADYGAIGIDPASEAGQHYLTKHAQAVAWAKANRTLCAQRVLEALDTTGRRLLDICHNSVEASDLDGCACWLHRKGAAPSDAGLVVVPGSRGDVSYLVRPTADRDDALRSIAHGAGRKIARREAHGKLRHRYSADDLKANRWGGRLICGERDLIWEEAADCYKDIATVIEAMEAAGLITVVAIFRPWLTFKTSEQARIERTHNREQWQRERAKLRAAKYQR